VSGGGVQERALTILATVLLAVGCGDGVPSTVDAQALDAAADANPVDAGRAPLGPSQAALGGVIVDDAGEPVGGLKVLCCNSELCIVGDSAADGSYLFWAIDEGPRKMEIFDPMGQHARMMFHQVAVAGRRTDLSRPVILARAIEGHQPWPAAVGGVVELAQGALTLTVSPGALHYPPEIDEEVIGVHQFRVEDLPPSDREPWIGLEDQSYAFLFDPLRLDSDAPVQLRFTPPIPLAEGLAFRLWTVDHVLAELVDAGTARVGPSGDIESEREANIDRLGMLFVVPDS
jgi:hypothetical protein